MTLPIKCHRSKIHMHISVKILEYLRFFFNVVKEDVYYAHQDCIYLIKNTVKKKRNKSYSNLK